jgi:hypothetical protein
MHVGFLQIMASKACVKMSPRSAFGRVYRVILNGGILVIHAEVGQRLPGNSSTPPMIHQIKTQKFIEDCGCLGNDHDCHDLMIKGGEFFCAFLQNH